MTVKRIRIRRKDRKILKRLGEMDEIQDELGVEEPTYEDVLQLILPEVSEDTIMERPEEDMVFVNLEDMYDRTHELAGENISAHRVIREYTEQFLEEREIELTEINP